MFRLFTTVFALALIPSTAFAANHTIRGIITDAGGKPVAGADVWFQVNTMLGVGADAAEHRTTGDDGRFQFTVTESWFAVPVTYRQELGLVAFHEQHGLDARAFYRSFQLPQRELKLQLQPLEDVAPQIVGADSKPVVDASVRIIGMNAVTFIPPNPAFEISRRTQLIALPSALSHRFTAKTDAEGRAGMLAISAEQIAVLEVTSQTLGQQTCIPQFANASPPGAEQSKPGPSTDRFKLKRHGGIVGRLVADNPRDAAGVQLTFSSRVFQGPGSGVYGNATVETNAKGEFEVPAIAVGQLTVAAESKTRPTWRLHMQGPAGAIKAGETLTLEIPWKPGIRATGKVVDASTGKPIAGLPVTFLAGWSGKDVKTNADGEYEGFVAPGQVFVLPNIPEGYLPEDQSVLATRLKIAKDDDIEMPLIKLKSAGSIMGRVVDADERPVAGAIVRAVWTGADRSTGNANTLVNRLASSNDNGEFTITDVATTGDVRLTASHKGAVVKEPVRITVNGNATLPISDEFAIALTGTIVDRSGQPVANETVSFERRAWAPPPHEGAVGDLQFATPITTDEHGRFQTPRVLDRDGRVRAIARAGSTQQVVTRWIDLAKSDTQLPKLVINRASRITGGVVAAGGKPVTGADVTLMDGATKNSAVTANDGRFEIEAVAGTPAVLIVTHPDFQISGQILKASGAVQVELVAKSVAVRLRNSRPLDLEQRHAIALPIIERLLKSDDATRARAMQYLAFIDPERVLDELDIKPFSNPQKTGMVKQTLIAAIAAEQPEDAVEIAESIGAYKALMLRAVYESAGDSLSREQRLDLLSQALVIGRADKTPAMKLHVFGSVGEALLDLGERDQAVKILREGQKIAEQLPNAAFAGFSRGAFASELGQIDVEAAIKLCADLADEREYGRHHTNLAHELAAIDPAAAERVLGLHKPKQQRDIVAPRDAGAERVCYRMATVDLQRAERIAGSIISPSLKGRALGLMARRRLAMEPPDRENAARLLNRAYETLEAASQQKAAEQIAAYHPSIIAAELLDVVEALDPQLVPEYMWRTVTFRRRVETEGQYQYAGREFTAGLCLLLAGHDRSLAAQLLGWLPDSATPVFSRSLLPALTTIDPERGVEHAKNSDPKQQTRDELTIVKFLSLPPERLRRAQLHTLALWFPDDEDHGPVF